MSLYIDVDKVTEVLLADGWHTVADESFDLDSYEYHHGELLLHGGGSGGICATGFTFIEDVGYATPPRRIAGPLTAILAVREERE
jgi:hypothetical protein